MAAAIAIAPVSAAAGPCRKSDTCTVQTQPTVTDTGYAYSFDGDGNITRAKSERRTSSDGTPMEYRHVVACAFNRAPAADGTVDDALCSGAFMSCDEGEIRFRMYWRRAGSQDSWSGPEMRCLGGDSVVPVAEVRAAAREQLERMVGTPEFAVEPVTKTLVHLPTLVHVTGDGRVDGQCGTDGVCLDVTAPVPGRLEAHPTYVWQFCDSENSCGGPESEGPGRKYDGTDPTANPGYYVSYAYQQTGAGKVVLKTVWKATFTIAGLPPIELDDLRRESTQPIDVLEARSQLVASY